MKLQFLIPQYKETDSVIKPLLDSIAIQQNVDFNEIGVVICNDGSDVLLSENLLNSYPFHIEYHREPHKGVSSTRNSCLDYATADYVMFCDADDLFCDVCGLYIIFREIDNGGFDTLVSAFREETRTPDKQPVYINHDMDQTFVHGKVHRREYLVKNGIRFNPKLTIHEDSYFNVLAQALTNNAKYCPSPFYLWKWRDSSVCRHDKDYILKTYGNMLDSNDALVDEFVKRMMPEKANFHVGFMVFDAYYTMNKPEWLDKTHADYRAAVEKRFRDYMIKHKAQFDQLTAQEKMQISLGVRQRAAGEGMLMEALTLDQWLDIVSKGE